MFLYRECRVGEICEHDFFIAFLEGRDVHEVFAAPPLSLAMMHITSASFSVPLSVNCQNPWSHTCS